MKTKGQRQSTNVIDRRPTANDLSMGMNTTLATQAAPKGNRPRYDKAVNQIRSTMYKQRADNIFVDKHLQDMLDRMKNTK